MRLKAITETVDQWLSEFDVWVTPSLTDIRGTGRFQKELQRIKSVFDALDLSLDGFSTGTLPTNGAILDACIHFAQSRVKDAPPEADTKGIAFDSLLAVASVLFLVTGKSDNNNKCQFPLHLRSELGWQTLPTKKNSRRGTIEFYDRPIPRVLDSKDYLGRVADMLVVPQATPILLTGGHTPAAVARQLLSAFVMFILRDKPSLTQLAYIGHAYSSLKRAGKDADALLTPLVIFQVRGSVSASGGHEPEQILRRRMGDWGLVCEVDFNGTDVVLDAEAGRLVEVSRDDETQEAVDERGRNKTRAYDFVLPFRVDGWPPRIFVQAQFYAGDSGSVSHKNVDQTDTSRASALALLKKRWKDAPPPHFIEYVDGAGYSASLNRDLKTILKKDTTKNFFQIRSATIRLRHQIQAICFLTPIEIEHALFATGNSWKRATSLLLKDGYQKAEIDRCFAAAITTIRLVRDGLDTVSINPERIDLVRCYMLLDLIANEGQTFASIAEIKNTVLVPGYGPYYGLRIEHLGDHMEGRFPGLWSVSLLTKDLAWLGEQGFIMLR